MQNVSAAFTAEERDEVRSILANLQVSWKKDSILGNVTFTIGVSSIGGNDVIGINPGAIGSPGNYKYFDESEKLLSLAYERSLSIPLGGLSMAMAEARLNNTSGRYTPRYMGGSSELFTSAMLPRRPMIINAGFEVDGQSNLLPQFAGITTESPYLNSRGKYISLKGMDYINFLHNRFVDNTEMYTGQTTDTLIERLLLDQGLSTSQYELDTGINTIPFALFERGQKLAQVIGDLVEAEGGYFYQDEEGIFRFENRQHWDNSPHTSVQRILLTGQVIDAEAPTDDHIVNVVEIKSKEYKKQPAQIIFRLNPFNSIELAGSTTTELFIEFEDPALSIVTPTSTGSESYFVANSSEDGSGSDLSSSVTVTRIDRFTKTAKLIFTNASASTAYITSLVITGRVAKTVADIYTRAENSSSVTAYEERPVTIENQFIQNQSWAESYAQLIVESFGEIEDLQTITIRAVPELQLGDLISWQGQDWRVFGIRGDLSPASGYIQELTLIQRDVVTYFKIGISTIGGTDKIAP